MKKHNFDMIISMIGNLSSHKNYNLLLYDRLTDEQIKECFETYRFLLYPDIKVIRIIIENYKINEKYIWKYSDALIPNFLIELMLFQKLSVRIFKVHAEIIDNFLLRKGNFLNWKQKINFYSKKNIKSINNIRLLINGLCVKTKKKYGYI